VHKNLETVLGPAGLDFGFAKLVVLTSAPIKNTTFQAVLGWFAGGYSCRAGKAPPPLASRREALRHFLTPPFSFGVRQPEHPRRRVLRPDKNLRRQRRVPTRRPARCRVHPAGSSRHQRARLALRPCRSRPTQGPTRSRVGHRLGQRGHLGAEAEFFWAGLGIWQARRARRRGDWMARP
jgi:hypothetical protein